MSLEVRVDKSKIERVVARWTAGRPDRMKRYLTETAERFATATLANPQEDTRRYKRAFCMAARQVGANVMVPSLKPSEYTFRFKEKAKKDIAFWTHIHNDWKQKDAKAHGKWPLARKKKAVAYKKLGKAWEQLRQIEAAGQYGYPATAIGVFRAAGKSMQFVTAIYGGEGRFVMLAPGHMAVKLTNMEAHANIVERHYKQLTIADSFVQSHMAVGRIPQGFLEREAKAFAVAS